MLANCGSIWLGKWFDFKGLILILFFTGSWNYFDRKFWLFLPGIFLFFVPMSYAAIPASPLTLQEAEQLAIARSPELHRLRDEADALDQQAVADAQLPDPKLVAGMINVPTNTFSFTQDEMTMIQAGLEQSFPRGHSLAIKSQQTQAMAAAIRKQVDDQSAVLKRNVRDTWLELYYALQSAQIIKKNRSLTTFLVKATESQYAAAKTNETDVLQAQVELSRLDDALLEIQQQIATLRAQLQRWIGDEAAQRPLPAYLPEWPNPPSLSVLRLQVQHHPLLQVDSANIAASRKGVDLAKEQYKPGWTVDVDYGFRQGDNADGSPRSDMLTAALSLELPLFPRQRQDRSLRASTYRLEESELDQQAHYRDLIQELNSQYVAWQRLGQREKLYDTQLIRDTNLSAKAALLAYQSATTDLVNVLRAYSAKLAVELEGLRIQVERAKARSALLYLEGSSDE